MLSANITEQKLSKYKKTASTLFISRRSNASAYFHVLCYNFVETIFNMKLNTLSTTYADTLTYNFSLNYYEWRIISLSLSCSMGNISDDI